MVPIAGYLPRGPPNYGLALRYRVPVWLSFFEEGGDSFFGGTSRARGSCIGRSNAQLRQHGLADSLIDHLFCQLM